MGRKLFISKSYYDKYEKFKCPLKIGFWHYSPNGCCVFLNEKTNTLHHLYLRESCSLTRNILTIQKLLASNKSSNVYDEDDVTNDNLENFDNNDDCKQSDNDTRFLSVQLQPYLNNATIYPTIEQTIMNGLSKETKDKILLQHDEILQQYWFIVCDTNIEYLTTAKTPTEANIRNLIVKNLYGPLIFCSSIETLSKFFSMVTNRFIHQQMSIINNMTTDRVLRKINNNIAFIKQFPAQRMLQYQSDNSLFYLDARDLFDVVKVGRSSEYVTNMRTVHLTNELNFLDTWRRILFNFVHELVNIHSFEKQNIRIGSTCNSLHFLKGNNKTVVPEFRCNFDSKSKCVHLMTRRKEYEMSCSKSTYIIDNQQFNHTVELSDKGVICRHVLEVLVDEYGREMVDNILNFNCLFSGTIYEHSDIALWEHIVYETLGVDNRLVIRDGSAVSRERIACMQILCGEKRMNDIHRFCLPKRFLTLAWFEWACSELKLKVFEE